MKFLCDNCKAKYQIADEKVAGKTVRMKCRKCGHQIEVRAAVTETSVATNPPRAGAPPPAPRAAQKPSLATSLSATKPKSASIAPGALAGAFKSNIQETPASVTAGALPMALAKSRAPAEMGGIELSVTDEWYVAINGVPVGPVRISELRRKAAGGAVTEESLCWQEGLEEWRPIRSIPELAAIVREAASGGGRPSLIAPEPTPPPPPPRISSIPQAPRPPAAPRASHGESHGTPPAPATRPMLGSSPSPGAGRSNVVPLRPAASSSVDDMGLGLGGGAAAAFAPAPALSPLQTPPTPAPILPPKTLSAPMVPLATAADPFALPPPPPSPAAPLSPLAPYRDSVAPPPPAPADARYSAPPPQAPYADAGQRKTGVPLWFWPILVLALGFGGGVAFLVFRPQPPQQPVVIQMPAPTPAPTPTEKADPPPAAPTAEPTPAPAETAKGKPVAVRTTPKAAPEEKKGLDLGGMGVGSLGPNVGPSGPAAGGGSTGLDSAGVERVVANHRAGVKRSCWERGGADQKSSVNVMITANVAPNGAVSSTSSSGDDPIVAKCIETQVKSWTFPAPGAPTTLNIPFKFVRQ